MSTYNKLLKRTVTRAPCNEVYIT